MARDALRVNLLPLQALLAEFQSEGHGIPCRPPWAGGQVAPEVGDGQSLKLLRVLSDTRGKVTAEAGGGLLHGPGETGTAWLAFFSRAGTDT